MRRVKVWDLPTRLFHWLLVGFVVFAWLTGEEAEEGEEGEEEAQGDAAADELEPEEFDDEGFEDAYEGFEENQAAPTALADGSLNIHEIVGYVVLGLLFFRILWGVFGGEHARFANFLRGGRALGDYVAKLLRFAPPSLLGHNPLGGWFAMLLLGVVGAIVWTGIAASTGGEANEAVAELHAGLTNVLIALVVVHIVGVVGDTLLTGDNLTRAMVTGTKLRPEGSAERDARASPQWAAVLALAAAAAAVGYIIAAVGL
jgi:cytochrome b